MKSRLEVKHEIAEKAKPILETNPEISMDCLLKEIGYSRSVFYRLFHSKGELFSYIFSINESSIIDYYNSIKDKYDFVNVIVALLEVYYKSATKIGPRILIHLLTEDLKVDDISEQYRNHHVNNIISMILKDEIRKGNVKSDVDVEFWLMNIIYVQIAILLSWAYSNKSFDLVSKVLDNIRVSLKVFMDGSEN